MEPWRWVLFPFSWLYGIVILLRNVCYDAGFFNITKVHVPVISVGNMTVGGTGKTPFVEYLVRYCENKNKKVAVLSRGYKRRSQGTIVIGRDDANRGDAKMLGDEPYQLARKFPHLTMIVDSERARAAEIAVNKHNVEVILLDDGFQHRALARDLDIVIVDGQTPLEKIPLLPAGKRREPLSSLRRANVIAYSRAIPSTSKGLSQQTIKVEFVSKRLHQVNGQNAIDLSYAKGKSCVTFCGIGTPPSFRQSLESIGLSVLEFFSFPDHHEYTRTELEKIHASFGQRKADVIVTTEKDAVKLLSNDMTILPAQSLFYLEIQAEVRENELQFHQLLDNTLKGNS